MKDKKWSNVKIYYSVLTVCLLLIVGVSAAIYNSSLNKVSDTTTNQSTAAPSTVSKYDEQANVTATGIPKTTESATTQATVSEKLLPYHGEFVAPTDGKVIKDYSNGEMVKNETMGDWRIHNGVDFSANEGGSVFAVQNGTVTSIDKDSLWGVIIELTCPGDLTVRYCGLQDNINVKKGDAVSKGDIIGVAGTLPVESADGVHIHIETKIKGETESPLDALNLM